MVSEREIFHILLTLAENITEHLKILLNFVRALPTSYITTAAKMVCRLGGGGVELLAVIRFIVSRILFFKLPEKILFLNLFSYLFNILVTTYYVSHKVSNHIPCEGQLRLL